jgi:hypothetical protein
MGMLFGFATAEQGSNRLIASELRGFVVSSGRLGIAIGLASVSLQ